MVGLTELESVTSCVSSRRSNQLSYRPVRGGVKLRVYHGSPSDRIVDGALPSRRLLTNRNRNCLFSRARPISTRIDSRASGLGSRTSWYGAKACHGRVCVGKPEGLPNWHSSDEDLSLHSSEQKSLAGDPGLLGTPVSSRAWAGAT